MRQPSRRRQTGPLNAADMTAGPVTQLVARPLPLRQLVAGWGPGHAVFGHGALSSDGVHLDDGGVAGDTASGGVVQAPHGARGAHDHVAAR